uniref:Uncharacterized protein n=1 Tax=Ciona savignyi TaxID=51511 RepID=H2Y536_CIOSA
MTEHISWSHFVEKYLVSGEVVQISMISRHSAMVHLQRDAVFDGKRVNFLVIDNLKNPASLEEMLRREESRLNVNPLDAIPINSLQPSTGRSMLTTFFWTSVLLIGGLALFMKNSPGPSSQQIFKILSPSKGKLAKPTGIFFKDVAGMKEA